MSAVPERFRSTTAGLIGGTPAVLPQGTSQSQWQNIPINQHGGVDWRALALRQLRAYSTEDLEAELARRLVVPLGVEAGT